MKDNIYIGFTPSGYDGHDLSFTLIDGKKVYAIELEKILKLRHYKYSKTNFGLSFDSFYNFTINNNFEKRDKYKLKWIHSTILHIRGLGE